MRKVRASELGTWAYCQRAWGYARQGKPSSNQDEMASGSLGHTRHAAGVKAGILLAWIAGLAFLAALIIYLIQVIK